MGQEYILHINSNYCYHSVPGLLSVGGESKSLIWLSLSPSTHCTSKVLSKGQLDVHKADTAAHEQPASNRILKPARKPTQRSHVSIRHESGVCIHH